MATAAIGIAPRRAGIVADGPTERPVIGSEPPPRCHSPHAVPRDSVANHCVASGAHPGVIASRSSGVMRVANTSQISGSAHGSMVCQSATSRVVVTNPLPTS